MRVSRAGPGYLIRDLRHRGEEWPVAYGFSLDDGPAVLGVGRPLVRQTLGLLLAEGDLATFPDAANHPYTRAISMPDRTKKRLVVVLGCRERLQVERLARGYRFDLAERRRLQREAAA